MSTSDLPDAKLLRPTSEALELIKSISPHIRFSDYPKKSVFPCVYQDQILCYVVEKGHIAVHRKSDDLLMSTIPAPALLGLGSFLPFVDSIYFKTVSECTLGSLPRHQVMEIVEKNDLWKPMTQHLITVMNTLFLSNFYLSGTGAYEIIRTQLLLLMNEPDEYREAKPVSQYIQEKTLLSRSGIMKILSQLRRGGYIDVSDGILKHVNKLPAKY